MILRGRAPWLVSRVPPGSVLAKGNGFFVAVGLQCLLFGSSMGSPDSKDPFLPSTQNSSHPAGGHIQKIIRRNEALSYQELHTLLLLYMCLAPDCTIPSSSKLQRAQPPPKGSTSTTPPQHFHSKPLLPVETTLWMDTSAGSRIPATPPISGSSTPLGAAPAPARRARS